VSLVEKALEKLRTTGTPTVAPTRSPAPHNASASVAREAATQPVREIRKFDPATVIEPGRRTVRIDEVALRHAGVLAPDGESRRAADQYRTIKRSIIKAAFGSSDSGAHHSQLVAISSALPGDGKTQTCINVALSLALEKDHQVVLIDADIAKPHVSRLLGIEGEPGLIDVLTTKDMSVRSAILATDRPNLWVLPAGRHSDVAMELLASHRMRDVVEEVVRLFPHAIILFDTSPILLTMEARVLTSMVGQVVLVVKANGTPQQAVLDAVHAIGNPSRIRLVLNQVSASGIYAYYDGRWYGYGTAGSNDNKTSEDAGSAKN
jgi:protein-tyrosine kinase